MFKKYQEQVPTSDEPNKNTCNVDTTDDATSHRGYNKYDTLHTFNLVDPGPFLLTGTNIISIKSI